MTTRLLFVGIGFFDCCTLGLIETLRVCGEGWIIGCGSRLVVVEGNDTRAGDDGVMRVG